MRFLTTVFLAVIIMLCVSCNTIQNPITQDTKQCTSNTTGIWNDSNGLIRNYPSGSLKPTTQIKEPTVFDNIDVLKSINIQKQPTRQCAVNNQPYVFVNTNNPQRAFGNIYYSDGTTLPTVIHTSGMSPIIRGGYVYFIRIDNIDGTGMPTTSTIVKYNISTHALTTVVTSKTNPCWSNFDISEDELTIIYNDCGPAAPNQVSDMYIYVNGTQEYHSTGRYFSLALSGNGKFAFWVRDVSDMDMGDHDLFMYNIDTNTVSTIHNTGSGAECADVSCDFTGNNIIYRIQIGEFSGGNPGHWSVLNAQLWYKFRGGLNTNNKPTYTFTSQIDTEDYTWCEIPTISPSGLYIVLPANKNVELYAGYAIIGVEINLLSMLEIQEITVYNSGLQDLWCDTTSSGDIIFANCISNWSHYNPCRASFSQGEIGDIVNLAGINRDLLFKN